MNFTVTLLPAGHCPGSAMYVANSQISFPDFTLEEKEIVW